jgi:hypothetical protein
MHYALLIYSEPPQAAPSAEQQKQVMEAYNAYTKALVDADAMRGGEALQDGKTATTVRLRNGRQVITDGPFAETKEEFGGFYLIEAANLDDAIAWAAKCPGAQWGSIEVRPIMEVSGMTDDEAAANQPVGAAAG